MRAQSNRVFKFLISWTFLFSAAVSAASHGHLQLTNCQSVLNPANVDFHTIDRLEKSARGRQMALRVKVQPRNFADFGFDKKQVDPGEEGPQVLREMHPRQVRFLTAQLTAPERGSVLKSETGDGQLAKLETRYRGKLIQTGANFVYRRPRLGRKATYAFGKEFAGEGVVLWLHGGGTPTANSSNASGIPGMNVLAVDLGGHGNSDQYPFVSGLDQILYLSEVIRQHIHPDVPVTIAGHSWGGRFVLQFFLDWPKIPLEVRNQVKALVSLSPPVDSSNGGTALERLEAESRVDLTELTQEEIDRISKADFQFLTSLVLQGKVAPTNSVCCLISSNDFQFRVPSDGVVRPSLTVMVGEGDGLVRVGHGRERIQDDFFHALIEAGLMRADQYIVMPKARTFESTTENHLFTPGHDIYPFYMSEETKLAFGQFLGPRLQNKDVFEVYTRLAKIVAQTVTPPNQPVLPANRAVLEPSYLSALLDEALELLSRPIGGVQGASDDEDLVLERVFEAVRLYESTNSKLKGELAAKYDRLQREPRLNVKEFQRELQVRSALRDIYRLYSWNLAFRVYLESYHYRDFMDTQKYKALREESILLKPYVSRVEAKVKALMRAEKEGLGKEVAELERQHQTSKGQWERELTFQLRDASAADARLSELQAFVQVAKPIRDRVQRETQAKIEAVETEIPEELKALGLKSANEVRELLSSMQKENDRNNDDSKAKNERAEKMKRLTAYLAQVNATVTKIRKEAFELIEEEVRDSARLPDGVRRIHDAELELDFVRSSERIQILRDFGSKLAEIERRRSVLDTDEGQAASAQRALPLALQQEPIPPGFGSGQSAFDRAVELMGIETMTYVPSEKADPELAENVRRIVTELAENSKVTPGQNADVEKAVEALKQARLNASKLEREALAKFDGGTEHKFVGTEAQQFRRTLQEFESAFTAIEKVGREAVAEKLKERPDGILTTEDVVQIQERLSLGAPGYLKARSNFLNAKRQYYRRALSKIMEPSPADDVPEDLAALGTRLKEARQKLEQARSASERAQHEQEVLAHQRWSLAKQYWSYLPGYRVAIDIAPGELLRGKSLDGLYTEILQDEDGQGPAKLEALRNLVSSFHKIWLRREPIEKKGGEIN